MNDFLHFLSILFLCLSILFLKQDINELKTENEKLKLVIEPIIEEYYEVKNNE